MYPLLTSLPALREYMISPILVYTVPLEQYERRRHELGPLQDLLGADGSVSTMAELSSTRTHKVLDSALSGMVAGGMLRGLKCMFMPTLYQN